MLMIMDGCYLIKQIVDKEFMRYKNHFNGKNLDKQYKIILNQWILVMCLKLINKKCII